MGKITIFNKFSNLTDLDNVVRFISAWTDKVTEVINGGLEFTSNIRSSGPFTVGFTNSSNIVGITHGLGVVPQGFLNIKQTAPASIYQPQGTSYMWTSSIIYLQASAGVTASIYII